MRKLVTTLLAAATCLVVASSAHAVVLLSEGFSYANGPLVANSGGNWTTHSGAGGIDIAMVSGRAVCNMANAPDDNRTFTAQTSTTPIYTCFEVNVADPAGIPKLVYFQHLKETGTVVFVARVYVAPLDFTAPADSGWTFALSHSSTNTTTVGVVPWSSTSLVYGQTYRIVTKYEPGTSSKMWVDPVNESSPSISQTGTTATLMVAAALRQSSTAAGVPPGSTPTGSANWTAAVDNLGVGTSFDDACYQVTPAKTATWGKVKSIYR